MGDLICLPSIAIPLLQSVIRIIMLLGSCENAKLFDESNFLDLELKELQWPFPWMRTRIWVHFSWTSKHWSHKPSDNIPVLNSSEWLFAVFKWKRYLILGFRSLGILNAKILSSLHLKTAAKTFDLDLSPVTALYHGDHFYKLVLSYNK